ncbi:MAG: 50S ribosomal protein L32 [bacterium]|nr:50S ribosomal protein L32 [bacterium]
MAQPKKKTSSSKQGHRRSHWKAVAPNLTKCSNCSSPKLQHTVCRTCGFYNGKQVMQVAQ